MGDFSAPETRRIGAVVIAVLLVVHHLDVLVVDLPIGLIASDYFYDGLLVSCGLLCIWRAVADPVARGAWTLIGAGMVAWAAGDIYFSVELGDMDTPPAPSPADIGYLLLPPLVLAGIVTLLRTHARGLSRAQAADGVIVGLAVAAGSAAATFETVVDHVTGSAAEIATSLAYPIADVILLGVLAGALAGMGWRLDATLLLFAGGLTLFAISDSAYVVKVAEGTYEGGSWLDAGWSVGLLLMGLAACGPAMKPARRLPPEDLRPIAVPLGFACAALGLLVVGCFTGLNPLAVLFAGACLVAVLVRLLVTFQHDVAMLGESREEALRDSLTTLRNRRALLADLAEAMIAVHDHDERYALIVLEVDGIKDFNETLGRSAGDALIQRLAGRLRLTAEGIDAEAYRMRGGEFVLLAKADTPDTAHSMAARASGAVSEQINGFEIGCLHASVLLGAEATSIPAALRLADQRLQELRIKTRSLV